jgi:arylsulfatase A-like enzyme
VGGYIELPNVYWNMSGSRLGRWLVLASLSASLLAILSFTQILQSPPPDTAPQGDGIECVGCNVVLIVLDASRRDHLGVYGYPKNTTPNIDRLAADSYVFDEAISQATRTKPSVTSLFTSQYPSRHGVILSNDAGLNVTGYSLPPGILTIAETFKDRSYRTVGLIDNPTIRGEINFGKGFDSYSLAGSDRELTDGMLHFIDEKSAQGRFFAYLHFIGSHVPYAPPRPYSSMFVEDWHSPFNITSIHKRGYLRLDINPSQLAYVVSQYDGELAYSDSLVGEIIVRMRERGLLNRTMVVVTADHGEELLDQPGLFAHGWDPYEALIRVPLIIFDPSMKSPSRVAGQVRTVDIMPTLIDLTGGSVPAGLDGVSLRPALSGEDMRLTAFSERTTNGIAPDSLAMRSDGTKLICTLNNTGSFTSCRLFNLKEDPFEQKPMAEDVNGSLSARLREYYETNTGRRHIGPAEDVVLGNDTWERLRALGYM